MRRPMRTTGRRIWRRTTRRPWSRRRHVVTGALLVLLAMTGVSYGRALTFPGQASFAVRTVEWVRDHGGSPVVDAVETWYYQRQAPPAVGAPQDVIAAPAPVPPRPGHGPARQASVRAPAFRPPAVTLLPGVAPVAGEGVWRPATTQGGLLQTWVRPDAAHLPVVAAAVLVPRGSAVLHLSAGTREPVTGLATSAQVPRSARAALLATFNSGFKMQDSRGGWQLGTDTAVPLRAGRASLVVTRDGGWRIGAWGRDVGPAADVAAVRQNLDLVVAGGHAVPGLSSNAHGRWGTAHTQFQYTWRSGVGVDRAGDLVYVAGRSLTLWTLGQAMARLGVVEGMQLDVHTDMVSFNLAQHGTGGRPLTHRLLASMSSSGSRYLSPDQRDFFYLTRAGR